MHDELLGFGKHRDKTFKQTAEMAEYVEWALSIPKPKGRLEQFVAYLKAHNISAGAADVATAPQPPHRQPRH